MVPTRSPRALSAALAIGLTLGACASLWEEQRVDLDDADVDSTVAVGEPPICPGLVPMTPAWAASAPTTPLALPAMPASMQPRLAFWERVWGQLSETETLIVDHQRPWLVWASADCGDIAGDAGFRDATCGERITSAMRAARARLAEPDNDVIDAYVDADGAAAASARLMGVRGRREPLRRALARARAELPLVEGIFEAEGVPRAWARAAIVESLWRPEAVSRSGAVGTFQFTRATGRSLMTVDAGVIDERKDTLRSAVAAARYLSSLHRTMRSWPLALTAYNTGPTRLRRIMKKRGTTDLGVIADAGTVDGFGFDGQNYAAQVAAVVAVTADEPMPAPADAIDAHELTDPHTFGELAACFGTDKETLRRLNPAVSADVVADEVDLPAGFVVRAPPAFLDDGLRLALR